MADPHGGSSSLKFSDRTDSYQSSVQHFNPVLHVRLCPALQVGNAAYVGADDHFVSDGGKVAELAHGRKLRMKHFAGTRGVSAPCDLAA